MPEEPLASDVDFRDPDLADLVRRVGLRHVKTPAEFEWRLQTQLSHGVYQRLKAMRTELRLNAGNAPAAELAEDDGKYFAFLDAHPAACLAILEGRMGYYDRLLPLVCGALAGVPNGRILDLGCFCGLSTLYLARKFPDSAVVGVERLPGIAGVAKQLLARSGVTNASVVRADFTEYRPEQPFDAVVSLQTVPSYLLPYLPAEAPDDYRRGGRLAAELDDPASPARAVLAALTAVRGLLTGGGRAVFNERLQGLPGALLFHAALGRAGFEAQSAHMVDWHMANQKGDVQMSPLVVAWPNAAPPPLDESVVIDLYTMPAGFADLSDLPPGQSVTWQGLEAHANFRGLPGERDEIIVAAGLKNGQRMQQCMGVVGNRLAYVYLCDTTDRRTLTVTHARDLRKLFKVAVDQLVASRARGDVASIDADLDKLAYTMTKRFRRYEP